jgi:hypothetical protein
MAEVELPKPEELDEIKEKRFTRRVALVTSIFAVILAITSLGGSHAMKEMILSQQQASDQWAFYQAKVIREHLYRGQKSTLDSQLSLFSGMLPPNVAEQVRTTIDKLGKEEARYDEEKKSIQEEAKKLEHERDIFRSKDSYFEFAEVFLQIAIVMASVSILSGSRGVFGFAVVAATAGLLLSVNGYFLVFSLPFIH